LNNSNSKDKAGESLDDTTRNDTLETKTGKSEAKLGKSESSSKCEQSEAMGSFGDRLE
jgi:hypothetical protein